jgi:hypothetical protein
MSRRFCDPGKLISGIFGGAKAAPISSAKDEQRAAEERARAELNARAKDQAGRMATVFAGNRAPGIGDTARPTLLGR